MKDSQQRLSHITISLHWLIAVMIIGLLGVGIYMTENSDYSLYSIHKSVGILLVPLVFFRGGWRLINGWPQPVIQYKKIERR